MIADSLNGTYNISHDHRNLIVQLYYKREVVENDRMYLRTFSEFYKYDDAGNRIKKVVMKYTGEAQDPTIEDSGDAPPGWNYELIQHYVRDVTGNELAVYNDTTVTFWNVYGIDNAGKINYSDNSWNFYLKDHLGTPRVLIDQNGDIISAEDLDMWGYRMTDRCFQSDTTFYKYTGKERDVTTGYDYFGARYYDLRIGRWGQVEPLLEKYLSWSPYNYGLNNPLRLVDIDGRELYITGYNLEVAFTELQKVDSFQMTRDSETGKIGIVDAGSIDMSKLSTGERELHMAITTGLYDVELVTTELHTVEGFADPFIFGMFGGYDENNKATQYINMKAVSYLEKFGVEKVGKTVLHEIVEAGYAVREGVGYIEAHKKTNEYLKQKDIITGRQYVGGGVWNVYLKTELDTNYCLSIT